MCLCQATDTRMLCISLKQIEAARLLEKKNSRVKREKSPTRARKNKHVEARTKRREGRDEREIILRS